MTDKPSQVRNVLCLHVLRRLAVHTQIFISAPKASKELKFGTYYVSSVQGWQERLVYGIWFRPFVNNREIVKLTSLMKLDFTLLNSGNMVKTLEFNQLKIFVFFVWNVCITSSTLWPYFLKNYCEQFCLPWYRCTVYCASWKRRTYFFNKCMISSGLWSPCFADITASKFLLLQKMVHKNRPHTLERRNKHNS